MPPSTAARRNSLTPEQERAAQIEFARQNQANLPPEPEPEEAIDTAEQEREKLLAIYRRPKDDDFWEAISVIPAELWGDDCCLYLYRRNMDGEPYVARYFHPVDVDDIKNGVRDQAGNALEPGHGGGRYRLQLKSKRLRCIMDSFPFDVEPVSGIAPRPVASAPGVVLPPNAASDGAQIAETVLKTLQPFLKPDANMAEAVSAMKSGFEASLDIVKEAARAQTQGGQQESAVSQFSQMVEAFKSFSPQQKDTLGELAQLATILKTLQPEPQGGNFMAQIRDAFGEKIMERIFSDDKGGGSDWKMMAAQAVSGLVEKLPETLDKVITIQRQSAAQPRTIKVRPQNPATEKPATAEQPHTIQGQPAQPAGEGSEALLTEDAQAAHWRHETMQCIVQVFQREEPAENAIIVMDHIPPFARVLAEIAPLLTTSSPQMVMAWVREQPAFAEVKDDPRLGDFVSELQEEVKLWMEAQQ
jgi:hypothetical protein